MEEQYTVYSNNGHIITVSATYLKQIQGFPGTVLFKGTKKECDEYVKKLTFW